MFLELGSVFIFVFFPFTNLVLIFNGFVGVFKIVESI